MKLWKKILIIILILFFILILLALWRYNILTKIEERNSISNSKTNFHYYSKTNSTIMELWKKDGILKENLKQVNGTGDITIWKNVNTGEAFTFWNNTKLYSENTYRIYRESPY